MPSPTAMRDRYRRIAWQHRNKPGLHGLRPYTVAVMLGAWDGSYTGRGTETQTTTTITERGGLPPKVRLLNQEEIALGNLGAGSVEIGPITPDFAGGGTALSTLKTAATAGQTVHLLLTGPEFPDGAKFRIKDFATDRALRWMITAEPAGNDV